MLRRIYFISLLLTLLLPKLSNSQNIGIGGDVMYNFQSEGFGAGARVNFFPNNRLSFVPQFAYYFKFNKVNEYYAGLGLEYKFIKTKKINIYGIVQGAYNSWLNYEASPMSGAQKNNWNVEAGIGISNNWCLRPFMEYRYNIKFQETHLRLGILYIFGCNNKSKPIFGSKAFGHRRCAAYD